MKKSLNDPLFKYGIIAAAVIAVVLAVIFFWYGSVEISRFNSRSMLEWTLGGTVVGIDGPGTGIDATVAQFEWFEDDRGRMGLKSTKTSTYYFMGRRPDAGLGKFCVTGFATNDDGYSVLGIRIGTDELTAKTILLDEGYSIDSGALDLCQAQRGRISIILAFAHGRVSQIEAHLNTTTLFVRR